MITIIGDLGPLRDLLQSLKSTVSPRVMLTLISNRLVEYMSMQFKTRGRGEWAPLSAVTLSRRKRGGDQPLQDTGKYLQSFAGQPGADAPLTDWETFVEIGTADIRAPTLEFGARQGQYGKTRRNGPIPWGNIPGRPVIPTKEFAEHMLLSELSGMVEQSIGRR